MPRIVCSDEIKSVEVDSRPSDAIAIALRFKVPIFTNEKILSEAGIVLTEEEEKAEFGEVEDGRRGRRNGKSRRRG